MAMLRECTLVLLCTSFVLGFPEPANRVLQTGAQPAKVTTPLGAIEGAVLRSRLGRPIYAFRSIRYAKAPINELRFKDPVPIEKWEGVLNATLDGPLCPQPTTDPTSEDCLILNVYSAKLPTPTENTKQPVIVFFHSGDFYKGGSASYLLGPQYLLDQDVVLVTINYRLGSLGFLSTGDKESPGNYGLKDQVQALKFVRDNIGAFGGDAASVTILGHGAGAFSVTLHLLSPLSQGLFHKAIAMSGSTFTQTPIEKDQLKLAQKQARLLSCADDSSVNIVKCLRTKPAQDFAKSLPGFAEHGADPVLIWTPVIEGDFAQQRFLPQHPVQLLNAGKFAKVPFISGVTADEFADRAFNLISNTTALESLEKEFEKYAPISFQYERDSQNSRTISKELRKFYFGTKPVDNSSLPQLAQFYSDALVGFGVNRAVKVLAGKSDKPVYYYKFSYKGRYSHFYLPGSNGTVPYGVIHNDDLIYLFHISKIFPEFKPTDPESETIEKLTKLWAEFAKTGNPPGPTEKLDNVKWEPYTEKTQKYLDIGNKLVLNEKLFEKRYAEWEKLFPLLQHSKATVG